ncbi:MAG: methyltransferase domain-containing protein [Terriglobales bacterium]
MKKKDLQKPDEIGRAYDSIVARYESEFLNAQIDGKWLALFRAQLPADAAVLDLGCGPGLQSEILSKLGCSCTGVDVSEEMVRAARARVPGGDFHTASFLDIETLVGKFDGVLISYSLIHVTSAEAKKVLAQCRRVLKPGAVLALFLKEGVGQHYIDASLMADTRLFTCLWTQRDISEVLRKLGFSVLCAKLAPPESDKEFQFRKLFVLSRLSPNAELQRRLSLISAVLLDVDGTMTDGRKLYSENGLHTLAFDARDGLGIALMQAAGLKVAMISNGRSEILSARGRDLGICLIVMDANDKATGVTQLARQIGIPKTQIAFIGDDLWDLSAFEESGIGIAVRDAVPQLRAAADIVLNSNGGHGAIRELANMLLDAKGLDPIKLLAELS